jgi:hypothetical protein
LNEIANAPWRNTPNALEVAIEMTLVREAASVSDFCDRHAAFEHAFRLPNLALDQISMGRHAVLALKSTQELEGTQLYHRSEVPQLRTLSPAVIKMFAHPSDSRSMHAGRSAADSLAMTSNPRGDQGQEARLHFYRCDGSAINVSMEIKNASGKHRIFEHTRGEERQRARRRAKFRVDLPHELRCDVEGAIAPELIERGMSCMHLARHHDIELTRTRKMGSTAVLKTEPASGNDTKRILLMGMTREPLLEEFTPQ